MALHVGLVGLPNVGKSTLFNALTNASVPAENYPFCTIDPHVAVTEVPDERLTKMAAIFNSQKIIPTTVQFVDIAGLVKGAASGEGLGNKFLSNVMETDLILHVLRCFDDADITHVDNHVNPSSDFDTIVTELCLKDMESLEKRLKKTEMLMKKAKSSGDAKEVKKLTAEQELLAEVQKALDATDAIKVTQLVSDAREHGITTISLLAAKKFLVVANVGEDEFAEQGYKDNTHYQALISRFGQERVIVASARIEAELAQMESEEAEEMKQDLGITETGLYNIIRTAYHHLGLITFFTCGPKEAHAWSIRRGTKAPAAAGTIHSDLERGFICAETYSCQDMFAEGTEAGLKQSGKMRTEGKEYVIQDGDVINVRFNV